MKLEVKTSLFTDGFTDQFGNIVHKVKDVHTDKELYLIEDVSIDRYKEYDDVLIYQIDNALLIDSTLNPKPEFIIYRYELQTVELVYERELSIYKNFMFYIRTEEVYYFHAKQQLKHRLKTTDIFFSVSDTKEPHFNINDLNSNFSVHAFKRSIPKEYIYKNEETGLDIPMLDQYDLYKTVSELAGEPVELFKPVPGEGYVPDKNIKQLKYLDKLVKHKLS